MKASVRVIRDVKDADLDLFLNPDDAKLLYDAGLIEKVLVYQSWSYATLSKNDTYASLQKHLNELGE